MTVDKFKEIEKLEIKIIEFISSLDIHELKSVIYMSLDIENDKITK